ncbi:MAG: glycosyltransferase [Winogradskyella sp.]
MVFIGGINLKNDATGGEEAKNQQMIAFFKKKDIAVKIIDTHNWKRRLLILFFQIIRHTIFAKNKNIYLSLSYGSTNKLLKYFNYFKISKRNSISYFVIGGKFHKWIEENPQYVKNFKPLTAIFPESAAMVKSLNSSGLQNVTQVPNFKAIPNVTIKRAYKVIDFVFLSRILPQKGSELIIDAVLQLNKMGLEDKFSVSFYGNIDEELNVGYEDAFKSKIEPIHNITYKGFLKLSNSKNYEILSTYNAMLFPTFWKGEGYPGVLIDAFIVNMPIIASNWHHNKEIVKNKVNGLLIPAKDSNALKTAMETLILDSSVLKTLENGAKKSTAIYDIEQVLSPIINITDASKS